MSSSNDINWETAQLRHRIVLLEQEVAKRYGQVETLQQQLLSQRGIAQSKTALADILKSENLKLKKQIDDLLAASASALKQATASTTSTPAASSSSVMVKSSVDPELERLKRQLLECDAPRNNNNNNNRNQHHHLSTHVHSHADDDDSFAVGDMASVPPTEEDEIEAILQHAQDAVKVDAIRAEQEKREDEMLRAKFEALLGKK